MPFFAEQGWHCRAVSLRGHGKSDGLDRLDSYGIADFVADVAQAAQGLAQPPVIIGHSMGGMVAQRFACRHPVRALAMMASLGPGGLGGSFAHMSLRSPDLLWQLGVMQTKGPENVDYDVIRRGLFSPDFPMDKAVSYIPLFQRESQRANAELMMPQWLNLMYRPSLPALVLAGDKDAFIPYGDMLAAASFWNADLTVLPGLPHVTMLDSTWRQTANALAEWLMRLI